MTTIYKYPITITDQQSINLPIGAVILNVQEQHGELFLWAWVDPSHPPEVVKLEVFGTGHPMNHEPRQYIGTVQQAGGCLVWHIFRPL